ncbi:MAG TPA: sulfatase-like hydrolase/transferase [bacterium]|nr:sulfatase-like hydrolase/transferase [bacterium]
MNWNVVRGNAAPRHPHVFVFCIDSLRADCVEALRAGSVWKELGRPVTPAIDAFSAGARSHSAAISSSSWTKPSVPSMFLSMHPSEHGVMEVAKTRSGVSSPPLPGKGRTVAEAFRDAGYRTVGLAHNAQLHGELGFARGFDFWDADAGSGDRMLETLQAMDPFADGRPVFLYFHLIEPHWPFGENVQRRAEPERTGRFPFHTWKAGEWKAFKAELKSGTTTPTPEEVRFLRFCYRLAVEDADRAAGRILDALDERGLLERSFSVLTADHGEELLDHGSVGHGQSLHEELVRVPLFLRAGADTSLGHVNGRVETPVSHVDLHPTLLDAAGIAPDGEGGAKRAGGAAVSGDRRAAKLSGRSLLAKDAEPSAYAFSEVKHKRRYHQSIHTGRWKLIRSFFFRKSDDGNGDDYNNLGDLFENRAFRTQRALFDLSRDPGETRDRFADRPELADRLETALDVWWERLRPRPKNESAQEMEAELIRRLEALGYL